MEAGISGKPASKQEIIQFQVNQLTLAVRPLLFIYLFIFTTFMVQNSLFVFVLLC